MLAFHGIFGAYAFWLPNDPRGSWSDFVAAYELFRFGGPATKVGTRRSVAHRPHDVGRRRAAKRTLAHPPVRFDGYQARAVARGLGEAGYGLHALAVMPDPVHVVVAGHHAHPKRILGALKRAGTDRLIAEDRHPFRRDGGRAIARSCWAERGWTVYLDTAAEVQRAVGYVANNPVRDGLRPQRWPFLVPFGGEWRG